MKTLTYYYIYNIEKILKLFIFSSIFISIVVSMRMYVLCTTEAALKETNIAFN